MNSKLFIKISKVLGVKMVTGGDNKFKNSLEEILKHYDEYRDQANDIISLKKENRSPEQEQKREEYSQWAKENIVTKNNKSPLIDTTQSIHQYPR